MPRIELAYWHAGHQPGDVIDVSDDEARQLQKDGRVARILPTVEPALPPVEAATRKSRG